MHRKVPQHLFASLWFLLPLSFATVASAQPGKDKDPLSWDRNIGGLFARHCYDCHREEDPNGDVNLKADSDVRRIVENRDTWLRVLKMLESNQMPPPDARELSDDSRQLMLDFLTETLLKIDCDVLEPGRPTLRRLNRTEYDNVVEDLTGLRLNLGASFPPDSIGYGFDNIADALALTPTQVELYHSAAQTIVRSVEQHPDNALQRAIEGVSTRQQAREFLRSFASKAFRHPVDDSYLEKLLFIYDQSYESSQSHKIAVGHAMLATLISPQFLMRIERDRNAEEAFYPVSDVELASRLSFFLWSRGPDDELLSLATAQRLSDTDVLRKQVERMLADPKSVALVDNFFTQWLGLNQLATHQPNPSVFPEFTETLRQSMLTEVRLLLLDMIQNNGSLDVLVESKFGFWNGQLAAFYEMPNLNETDEFRKVIFPDRQRGGLLTSAAFLTAQSDPGRTNIPRRGNFIAGQLLGDPPPPPPPGVPPLNASEDATPRTLRETFELHRSQDECKVCHARIDPIGFALENYDAIGRFRNYDQGIPVDSKAELPSGVVIDGAVGLKDYLLTERDAILRTAAHKLMIYALGRGLQPSDECVVNSMIEAAKKSDDQFSSLVLTLVQSIPFTHRRNAAEH